MLSVTFFLIVTWLWAKKIFVNLFLYYYESRWIKNLQKKDLIKARKLCNIFCFIDDFNEINDTRTLESNFRDIYPEELAFCRENDDDAESTFLNLNIILKNNKFQIVFFKIKECFPFSIVRMCEKLKNIPSNILYMSTGSEYMRTARACND